MREITATPSMLGYDCRLIADVIASLPAEQVRLVDGTLLLTPDIVTAPVMAILRRTDASWSSWSDPAGTHYRGTTVTLARQRVTVALPLNLPKATR